MIVLDIPKPQDCSGCLFCDYEQGYCFLSTTDGTISTVKNAADYANGKTDKPKPEWCPFEKFEKIDTAVTKQKKSKDDDISTYQEYSYMRHPDRVEMGMY